MVNVGAGTGNYEPRDRRVVAVEPAVEMLVQRPADAAPAVRAVAESLPFRDLAFDAALATLTLHHWSDLSVGLEELRRVARRQIILLFEPALNRRFWLWDYFPQALTLASDAEAPGVADLGDRIKVRSVTPVPIPADCTDGFAGAYWCRPEAYLEASPSFRPKGRPGARRVWRAILLRELGTPATVHCEPCRSMTWAIAWWSRVKTLRRAIKCLI